MEAFGLVLRLDFVFGGRGIAAIVTAANLSQESTSTLAGQPKPLRATSSLRPVQELDPNQPKTASNGRIPK